MTLTSSDLAVAEKSAAENIRVFYKNNMVQKQFSINNRKKKCVRPAQSAENPGGFLSFVQKHRHKLVFMEKESELRKTINR